jgi:hypothetical protein
MSARKGGALLPVLILSGILLLLGSILPQVLVSASNAMKNDFQREHLLAAAESGVAIAEARIKRQLADDLLAGAQPRPETFTATPSLDNPDYGRSKDYTYDVAVQSVTLKDMVPDANGLGFRYSYQLTSVGKSARGQTLRLDVTGLITLKLHIDSANGGLATRSLEPIRTEAITRESRDPYPVPAS